MTAPHYCPMTFELCQIMIGWCIAYRTWQMALMNYIIWIFLLNRHTSFDYLWKKILNIVGFIFPSVDLQPQFPNRLWNISQSSKTHETHSNASDRQICKRKQEFYDFWAISYRFVQIVIVIQMHFVLLTTISLLFVQEGHFWIILKRGLSPQSPPFCMCLIPFMTRKGTWFLWSFY